MVLSCRGCQNDAFMGFWGAYCKFRLWAAAPTGRIMGAIVVYSKHIRRRRLGDQQSHGIGKLQRFLIPPRQAAEHNCAFLSLSPANHRQDGHSLVNVIHHLAVDFLIPKVERNRDPGLLQRGGGLAGEGCGFIHNGRHHHLNRGEP